jgi:hypothetical protein
MVPRSENVDARRKDLLCALDVHAQTAGDVFYISDHKIYSLALEERWNVIPKSPAAGPAHDVT